MCIRECKDLKQKKLNEFLRNKYTLDGITLTETLINQILYTGTRQSPYFPVNIGTDNDVIINIALNHLLQTMLHDTENKAETILHDEKINIFNKYLRKNTLLEDSRISAYLNTFKDEYDGEDGVD